MTPVALEGDTVGADEGEQDGKEEGSDDGTEEGTDDGSEEGCDEGSQEGSEEGWADKEGLILGASEGAGDLKVTMIDGSDNTDEVIPEKPSNAVIC